MSTYRNMSRSQLIDRCIDQNVEIRYLKRNNTYYKNILEKKNRAADEVKDLLEDINLMFGESNIGYRFDFSRYNAIGVNQSGSIEVVKVNGWHKDDGPVVKAAKVTALEEELENERAASLGFQREIRTERNIADMYLNELKMARATNDAVEFELAELTELPKEPSAKRGQATRAARKRISAAGGEIFEKTVTRSMTAAKRAKLE